jgi:hypothetical protein
MRGKMVMDRRTLFRGTAASLVAASLTKVVGSVAASAATYVDFPVAIMDAEAERVLVLTKKSGSMVGWDYASRRWSFQPDLGLGTFGPSWRGPTDVKFRNIDGVTHVLISCVGGSVGLFEYAPGTKKDIDQTDKVWSRTPGGKPHGVERIPADYGGAIVVACSTGGANDDGKVVLYRPSGSDYVVQAEYSFANAHCVQWDHVRKILWVGGGSFIRAYKITGTGATMALTPDGPDVTAPVGVVHDIQPDFTNRNMLLIADAEGGKQFNPITRTVGTTIKPTPPGANGSTGGPRIKSFSRDTSGEYFWLRAYGPDSTDVNPDQSRYVRFDSGDKYVASWLIYKVRTCKTGYYDI